MAETPDHIELLVSAIKHAKANAVGVQERRATALFWLELEQQERKFKGDYKGAWRARQVMREGKRSVSLMLLLETYLADVAAGRSPHQDPYSNTGPTSVHSAVFHLPDETAP
jgi:hypothetical protein